jgi:16S rRNA (guanine527-N7)-methyltransferase
VRSELHVALLEATEKKVRFLEYARTRLGLENIEVLHARAEDAGKKPACRGAFDFATARAVGALPVVVEYCAPFVRVGGTIVAMKGRLAGEELSNGAAASDELGVELREVREVNYRAQLLQNDRNLVVLDKVGPTPRRFPRRVGVAKKRPLGA